MEALNSPWRHSGRTAGSLEDELLSMRIFLDVCLVLDSAVFALSSSWDNCRVTPVRAFLHTGVDYAGPFTLKRWKGRGCKTEKGWVAVLVCFVTSAAHLEIVSDYSADTFLAAYRRFVSRRGIVQKMYSDCGITFQGAAAEIKKLFAQHTKENRMLISSLATEGTTWIFNPPASPHMGGKWEALVKSIKFHLRRTIGETLLTFEELTTLHTQVEAVPNSRPLEQLSDDPDDLAALTPGHFLIGSALNHVPKPSLLDISTSRLSRWQFIQNRLQYFWKHWSAHYAVYLQVAPSIKYIEDWKYCSTHRREAATSPMAAKLAPLPVETSDNNSS